MQQFTQRRALISLQNSLTVFARHWGDRIIKQWYRVLADLGLRQRPADGKHPVLAQRAERVSVRGPVLFGRRAGGGWQRNQRPAADQQAQPRGEEPAIRPFFSSWSARDWRGVPFPTNSSPVPRGPGEKKGPYRKLRGEKPGGPSSVAGRIHQTAGRDWGLPVPRRRAESLQARIDKKFCPIVRDEQIFSSGKQISAVTYLTGKRGWTFSLRVRLFDELWASWE